MKAMVKTTLDFFLSRAFIDYNSNCWEWLGSLGRGYSYIHVRVGEEWKGSSGHRWAYKEWIGEIPEGYHLHHTCFNPACVNPEHLEVVTPKQHSERHAVRKTHCIHGHKLTTKNTYISPAGYRSCLTCIRKKQRAKRKWPNRRPLPRGYKPKVLGK